MDPSDHPLVSREPQGFLDKQLKKLALWALNPSDEYPLLKSFLSGPVLPSLHKYSPIDATNRETRLVSLLPGNGWDPLKCRLRVVSLNDKPEYTALSYSVGTQISVFTIELEGQQVVVKANLAKALRRLRHPHDIVTIWIDAISIDQTNNVEKAAQVAMMEQIYRSCSLVYIWMGDVFITGIDGDTGCRRSIHDMDPEEWNSVVKPNTQSRGPTEKEPGQSDVHGAFKVIHSLSEDRHLHEYPWYSDRGEETAATFKAFQLFVMLEWWSRIWCVQEPILPPKALVVWGPYIAPWKMFADAAASFNTHTNSCCILAWIHYYHGLHKTILTVFAENVSELERVKTQVSTSADSLATAPKAQPGSVSKCPVAKSSQSMSLPTDHRSVAGESSPALGHDEVLSTKPTLTDLLWRFRNRRATDSRDLVYALFGLVQNWHDNHMPTVSYMIAEEEVWAMALLQSLAHGDLRFLMGKRRGRGQNQPRSWIPNWNQWTDNGNTINATDVDTADKQFATYHRFNASGGCLSSFSSGEYQLQDSKLQLGGMHVDRIRDVGSLQFARLRKNVTTAKTVVEWAQTVAKLEEIKSKPYPSGRGNAFAGKDDKGQGISNDEAFWRTMCRDMYLDDSKRTRRAIASDGILFKDYIDVVGFERLREDGGAQKMQWHEVEKMMNSVYFLTYACKFFVTEAGYFGLGNDEVKAGDQVWILRGGKVPFVLEEVDGREEGQGEGKGRELRLIGDCYLHGVMDGEWNGKEEKVFIV